MAAVFICGLAYQGCNSRAAALSGSQGEKSVMRPVAAIGGIEISADEVEKGVQAQMAQFGQMRELPPSFELMLAGQALDQQIQRKSILAMAKEKNVRTDDAAVLQFVEKQLDPKMIRAQLESGGQLKPGASDAEFNAVILKLTKGKPLAELLESEKAKLKADLADPEKGATLRTQVAGALLLEQYKARINPSDDELRRSFDVYEVKRISFPSGPDAKSKADAAYAKIKGGATFESVLDANSPAPPPGGKKASETPQSIPAGEISTEPEFAALRALKPGEITGVVVGKYDVSITKLIGLKNNAPKDFATNKAAALDKFRTEQATKALTADLKAYTETHKPTFTSPAYEALYRFSQLQRGGPGAPAPDDAKLREIIDLTKKVEKGSVDARVAAMVRATVFDQLYAKAKNKDALRGEYIETLQAQVEAKDDFGARMKLSKEYLAEKKYAEAANQLLAAARTNTSYDAKGQADFGEVASQLLVIKKAGTISADIERAILAEQDRWRNEKKASDKAMADAARQQAEDAKRMAAEKAKSATTAGAPGTYIQPGATKPKVEDKPKR